MGTLDTNILIIAASTILILSYFFGEFSRKTNIPSVLMLIILGILMKVGVEAISGEEIQFNFSPILAVLGTLGLIMIVLEAALELELKREKYIPIAKALGIALVSLMASAWAAAFILKSFIIELDWQMAWIYATPLSILSSAIIIPSVSSLIEKKKEFHIYESTFSDILGIILFYFLIGQAESTDGGSGVGGFFGKLVLTIVISVVASYLLIYIFQHIRSHVKLFLLIAVLLLLYAVGKYYHLSALIVILIFGLVIANMKLFFRGKLGKWLNFEKAQNIYEGLHTVTLETAFVVRTFFFVIFGLTISLSSLINPREAMISGLIILSIYAIRFVFLRVSIGKDIIPQLFIAPRGLITILLFSAIPKSMEVAAFDSSILLFIIIGTSLIMTFAMIYDKRRAGTAIRKAEGEQVGYAKWKAPSITEE